MDKTYMTENGKQEYYPLGLLVLILENLQLSGRRCRKMKWCQYSQVLPLKKLSFESIAETCWCIFNKINIFDGITFYVMSNRINLRKLSSLL